MHISEVNWLPFITYLENITGVAASVNIEGKRPEIVCGDLTAYVGILGQCLKTVSVAIFNFSFNKNPGVDACNIWVTVNIVLEHKQGGHNQVNLFSGWYYEETGWVFSKPA